jgi:hypothetical protein
MSHVSRGGNRVDRVEFGRVGSGKFDLKKILGHRSGLDQSNPGRDIFQIEY